MTDSSSPENPQNHDLVEGDTGADKPSQAEGSEQQADEQLERTAGDAAGDAASAGAE